GHIVRGGKKPDEIVIYSAPQAFFLWIVIATGFLLRLLVSDPPKNLTGPTHILTPEAGGGIFIFVLVYFILRIFYHMSVKKLTLVTLVFALLWFFARYMESLHQVAIIGPIIRHFRNLNPQYDHGTVSIICWLLLIPWVCSIFEMVFNRKKQFSPNEIA